MTRILLTGVVAGMAAALLFAVPHVLAAIWLFPFVYLAPMPIMTAALGWSHWAGLVAAVVAAMFGAALGDDAVTIFLVGAPAWWLGYLAMLGRPVANGGSARMEWYPPGRLVLWAALLGAIAGTLAILADDDALRSHLKATVEAVLRRAADAKVQVSPEMSGAGGTDAVVDALVQLFPLAAATIATLAYTANLWLAGLAVRLGDRLQRPWPDLTALSFPAWTAALYGAALAGAFLPGVPGVVASLAAAPLTIAFALVGFAVVHAVTRGMNGRAVILWAVYLCAFFLVSPMPVIVLGVTETLFDLRARFAKHGPPAAPT